MAKLDRIPEAPLSPEIFFGDMVGQLSGALEDVIGMEEASGFVGAVGSAIGEDMARIYDVTPQAKPARRIAEVCADLKARIGGAFEIRSVDDTTIVLIGHRCPFADRVVGRPSLCMMTTNVFGRIAAKAAGYANVRIDGAIAMGDRQCRVVISLVPTGRDDGHEFFA